MIKLCTENKKYIEHSIKNGELDRVHLSVSNFIDDIIIFANDNGFLNCLEEGIVDKRHHNKLIPFKLILTLAIASKMKVRSSLTDIPYAISDHRVLSKLGYTIVGDDDDHNLKNGLMRESTLRFLLGKYEFDEFFDSYNQIVQNFILPKIGIQSNIHILDCTKIEVNLDNENYEKSSIGKDNNGNAIRGYKLSTIRGIVDDVGIIEDVKFGELKTHDLQLSLDMVMESKVLKEGDILINDRGFISRELLNYLKTNKKVDTYVPLKKNMDAYKMAVSIAREQDEWFDHPNKKRISQKIALVKDLGDYWGSQNIKNDVPVNACVVHDMNDDKDYVFITTDMNKGAKEIIRIYELRPEIEEDYRQLKDFWNLEDFKSTKINVIAFHIFSLLLGYLFYQLYIILKDNRYIGKSLPILMKKYQEKVLSYVIIYKDQYFGIFPLIDFMDIYVGLSLSARDKCREVLKLL